MGVTLDLSGLESFLHKLEGLRAALNEAIAARLAERIAAGWSGVSPSEEGQPPAVVTGTLAGSIRVETSSDGARVGSDAPHGGLLEFGTGRMAARPWLRPSVEAVRRELGGIAREVLGGEGLQAPKEEGEQDART